MKNSTNLSCYILNLPVFSAANGAITAINNRKEIPFDVKRVYYLYDIPSGEVRGGHAHKELYQLIVAASGSFEIVIEDGKTKLTHQLNKPYLGLLVKPGIWRELKNFSAGSVCLVLASEIYSEEDYIRDYDEFLVYKHI
jgi:hypothetical protein